MGLADYWKSGAIEEEETGAIPEPAVPVQNTGLGDHWKGMSRQPVTPETTAPVVPTAQPSGLGDIWKNMSADPEALAQEPPSDKAWWEIDRKLPERMFAATKKFGKDVISGTGILSASEPLYYSEEEKAAQKATKEALGEKRYSEIQEKYSPNKGIIKEKLFNIADAEALKYDPKLLENLTFVEKIFTTAPQVVGQALISVASFGALSMPAMGAMIIGSSYEQMIKEGATHENAERQSILNALYQMPLEQLGIGGITKFVPGKKKIFQALKNLFMEGLGEGITEFLQEYPDAWTNLMAKEPDANSLENLWKVVKDPKTFIQALESGAIGFILGGGASAAGTGAKKTYNLLTGKEEPPTTPPPPGSDKPVPVEEVKERADANQILENAAANLEAQAGAIPEGPAAQMAQPEMPLGTTGVATEVTPEDILMQGEERRGIEAQAGEVLAPSAARMTPEQELQAGVQPAQIGVTSEQPKPIYDAQMVPPERIYEAIPPVHAKQVGVTSKQPVAAKAKPLTAEETKPEGKADVPISKIPKKMIKEPSISDLGELVEVTAPIKEEKAVAELGLGKDQIKGVPKISLDLAAAAEQTDPNPTKAEIKADSYDQGKLSWNGFKIAIETAKGKMRTGIDTLGKKWSQKMNVDYGKIKGIKGADGEDLDIAFRRSDNPKDYDNVYVIDQLNPNTGEFDEHKVYVGYSGAKQAELGYRANYEKGWKGFGGVTVMSKAAFKNFLKRMDSKLPAAGQEQITRKEWLVNPEARPEGYDRAEYRPDATGQVEKVVNATIEKEYETWSEKVAPKKTGPRIEQVTELIRIHRPDLNQGDLRFIDVNDITPGMRDQFRSAIMMAEALGNDTVIIESDIDLNLNGVFLRSLNLIVLNSTNPRPVMTVFMHESVHALQQSNPVLYKELEKYVFRNTKKGAYNRWLKKYKKTNINLLFDLPPKNVLRAEFVAYTVGVASGYESFYENLAKKDPALFKKVVDYTLESIRLIINKVGAYIAKYSRGEGKIEFKDANQAVKDIANMFAFAASETAANKEIDALVEEWTKEAAIDEEVKQFMAEEMAADIEVSEAILKWAKGTKVVDENGGPLKLYHATWKEEDDSEIDIFDIGRSDFGSHFGTKNQTDFGDAVYPVILKIKNPIRLRDLGDFDPSSYIDQDEFVDIVGYDAAQKLGEQADGPGDHQLVNAAARKLLLDKGVDGVVYLNRREGIPEKDLEELTGLDFYLDDLTDSEFKEKFPTAEESWIAFKPNQIKSIWNQAPTESPNILADIEVSEKDDSNTIAMNAISGLADGKTTIALTKDNVGARPIIESLGFVRQGKSNNYKFDERVPKDADIIAGMYQAAWHVDLKTKGTTKELFGQVSKRLGRIQREGLGEAEQSEDQKKFRNYLNESWLTYREAADATARGNQLPTKNVLVRPKSVESGRGRQLTVQIASDFRAEEASHIGDPYYEAIYNNREGYARPSRDFWEVPEWMTRLAYFMPKADVYVIRNLEEAIAFFNESNYDQIFFSVLDTNKRFVKHIAENYDGDIIAGGYLPDGSYYKGMKNVSWMANMEEAAKKVGVPFKNGVDYRHFEGTRTIPRLELSRGCLHKCAFCSQERTLKLATPAEIDNQINEFKSFDYDIVYLNDKTFGQAANYEQLIGVKEKIKKANPKFKGFVIQTTAGQYLKMSDQFLKDSGIIYVELGVETFNDKYLKSLHKPHTIALIEKATEKIRRLNQIFVPNVMVGLTGKIGGERWVESPESYNNTLSFLKRNRDIISHMNIGVLAAETGTELQKQLDDWQEVDTDEATTTRSWIKNKDAHEKFYYDLSQFGIEQLENKKVGAYVAQAIEDSQSAEVVQPVELEVAPRALFDIELEKTPKAKKIAEGGKGSATGSLLYNEITEIAKAAGGWAKIESYLDTIETWNGIPVSKDAVRFIGNTGLKLAKDAKLRNKVKSIESFRKRLATGEIDENSPEYKKAHDKYGSELKLRTVARQTRFHVGVNTIYGPKQEGDITKTIKKEHPIFGEFTTEITRDKDFKLVMDTPIFSNDYETRQKEIDTIAKENKEYLGWYDNWNSFIKAFKHLPEAKLIKYIKMMAVFSAGSGPQGNMKLFTMAANKLESGRALVSGSLIEGGDGVSKSDVPKIMAIWNDADPATTLEERREIYGPKVGTYMHIGLFPHADAIVIDRHMPRMWGYDITWSPNMKHKGFDVRPEVEAEIVRDIKAAAKRNNISTSAVQAAIWYKSRTPDVEASTYQEAAAMSPSEYLPGVMHAALRPESLGVGKHFKTTPLKKGEFILATKRDGSIEYNAYSRDDIGNRIYGHTDKNPYAELVYLYEASTMPEKQLKGKKNVYTVDLDQQRIYDGVEDIMGYWGFAAERLKADPFASLTNIFANLVKATEMFDGFVTNAPIGTGRWVLMFDKAEITGVPEDVVAGISDVVDTLESNFPQTIKGISAIFQGRSDKLYDKFKQLIAKYAEIREEYFKPTVARFKNATGGKHEISGMASLRGPLKSIKALMAEFGIENVQNNVILVHTEEGAERNGNFYRFKVKRDFKNVEEIYEKIASYGLEDYNISVTPVSGSFFIEQFVMDSYPESFVESFSKMINEISDKGFPQNITYEATSEVLGDPNWTGRPAKALKYYRADLIDYFGEKEGKARYAKAIKAAQAYKKEIGKRGAAGEALFDVDFTEDTGERVKQDYGRPVEGQDIEGQFERPGDPLFDIEAAEPGETRADLWYSQLQAMVESKSFPMKSSPKQMISVLEGMARKGQIKQTELDWAGLVDWLDYIKGPVTKAQVLEFLDKNNVKLEEKILGGDMQESEAGRRVIADTMLDGFDPTSPNWGILEDELATWVIKGGDIENYQTIQDLWDDTDSTSAIRRMGLNQWIDYHFGYHFSPEGTGVEYGQYTIDEEGSPEYREFLITLKDTDKTIMSGALEALGWYENKFPDAFPAMTQGLQKEDQQRYKYSKLAKLPIYKLQMAGAPQYLVTQFKKWQNSGDYKIPHWQGQDIPNVVVHLRADEKAINDKRTFFIEEIQSDWAQRGRKVGFIDYTKYAPVGYHFVKQVQSDKSYVVHQLVEDSTGKVLAEGSMRDEVLVKAGFKSGFIKNMPFRLSKDWALVVLKRAVRYAAENGYEQIAWTGGQIQADRYPQAFKKAVDVLYYNQKTGLLRGFKTKYEGEYTEIISQQLKNDEELAEYVGGPNAKIMLAAKPYNSQIKTTLKRSQPEYHGDHLIEDGDTSLWANAFVFKGQGIKAFYDEIVPSVFKRFFRKEKWGKPELEQQELGTGELSRLKIKREPGGREFKFSILETDRMGVHKEWNEYGWSGAMQYLDDETVYTGESSHFDTGYGQLTPSVLLGKDIKAAVIDWLQDGQIPINYSSIGQYLNLVVEPALMQELGVLEKTQPIWVSPVTTEMKGKALEEGFPMFDIEAKDIPAETGAVLKDKIGRKETKASTKIATAAKDFGEKWQTMMLDKLYPIMSWFGEASGAYMKHRGLPGVQSTLNAFMEQGKLKMLDDGSITTEESGKGFLKWLNRLGQDAEKFLYWQIAKRSEVLTGEDRELLLTDIDRKKIYDWVGEKPKTRDSWQEISDEFAEWNQNMLDIAIKAGLLSKEQIETWQRDFYIPFYRIFEDEQARMEFVRGPAKGKKYISAEVKRLRGSEQRMGDPLENIIKNWSALIGNSMFNIARKETFEFANNNKIMSGMTRINKAGLEEEVPLLEEIKWSETVIFKSIKGATGLTFVQEKTGEPVLAFKDGGKSVFFKVNDPELFNALSGINKAYFDNILMKVMSGSKRLLTLGATITPAFRIANFLRDTLHTFQISENFIPFWDSARGFIKIWKNDPEYAKFMASGHAFGGSYVRAEDPRAMKRYTDRIVKREGKGALSRILDTAEKLWGFWEEVGAASENAARIQLYVNLKKKGKTHQQAAFAARDLMDFQMSGASNVVQFLIQTVPFLNARVQGLYRMGRAAANNPKGFLLKGALISVASLALWLAYWDDDRYKELEDWERFAYYHFWIGGIHFRIPKPFETGVVFSSSVEAAANVMSGNDEITHVFSYLKHAFLETFAFNPIPQAIRPAAELYMNKSFFTGRQIESQSKQRLRPGDRFDPWDSETLRLLGDKLNISPKKAETLIRGYTAGLGMGILAISDLFVRNIADFPERPAKDIGDYPAIGRFVKGKVSRYTKHMSKFYDLYNEVDQLFATVNNYKRIGEFEKAQELAMANRKLLGMRSDLGHVRKELGDIGLEIRNTWFSKELDANQKRDRLVILTQRRNDLVRKVYDRYLKK